MKKLLTLFLMLSSVLCFSQSTTVVLSQVYGGGGGSTGTYLYDYVELHNVSNTTQSLTGMSLQYGSSTGNFGSAASNIYAFTAGASIPAGGYLLVQLGPAGTGGAALPVTPDIVTTNLTMSAASGKVVLANQATALGCGATATPCTLPSSTIIDLVSYGASNNGEGGTTVNNGVALTNTQGAVRKTNGCTETDNNNLDFDVITAPVPRNGSSPVVICGGSPTPTLAANPTTLPDFGSITVGTNSSSQSFNLSGSNLTGAPGTLTVNAPSTDFQVSNDNSTWGASTTIAYASATLANTPVYVRFTPQTTGPKSGNVTVSGGGASTINVAVSGTGVSASPTLAANPTTIPDYGNVLVGSNSTSQSFNLSGTNLTGAPGVLTVNAPSTDFQVSNDNSTWGSSTTIAYASATLTSTPVYVRFTPQSSGFKSGNVTVSGGGASAINVAVSGTGITGTSSITVVISQVFGGGGGSTGTYLYDYVELHNNGSTSQSLSGTSLQYGSSTGNFGSSATNIYAIPAGTTIPAGGYLLVQLGPTGTGGVALPVTPDLVTTNLSMSGASGKVALANQTTALGCGATATPCTLPSATIIDLVSYGASNNGEGGTTVNNGTALTSTQGSVRKNNGCTDTDNNNADFDVITAPVPRNSVSPVYNCGAPTPTLSATPTTIPDFGSVTVGTNSTSQSFNLSGANLTGAPGTLTVTAPTTDFQVSNDNSAWGASTTIAYASATLASTPVYVRFTPQSAGLKSGNVTVSGGGATTINVAVSGTGVTPTPVLSASALTAFGNVCINTTAGPNSFTITGNNLTAANVTVGPLSGYTFSTTAGGTYTASLTLSQPGGSYSQQIFVDFTPTVVQSYDGNIPVGGGGATTINVAASGSGVNTVPSLTSGSASSITTTSATVAGTITATGCSAVTAYGIEWSTTSGFVNGTGTQVPSSNLSGGNFTSNLGGLSPNTTYYYKAYATNAGGTGYGTEQSFTTLAITPTLNATTLAAFGNVCINTTAGPNSFTINGSALTSADITVGPLSGFTFSTTAGGTYTASLNVPQPGGTFTQTIYVNFPPTAVQSYDGNIPVGGGGATTINVAASGSGVNSAPSVTTGVATSITSVSATAPGSITSIGCSAITVYGIEWSTTAGFANGTGTQVPSSNLSGGNFSSNLSGLSPGTVYYFKAYATNSGGTTYGGQQSFMTATPTLSASALTAFGNVCINTTAGPNSFTITGNNLTTANVTVGPLAAYTFSTTSGGTYTASLNLTQTGGSYSQQVFVKISPTAVQTYNGNIAVGGGGATTINVAASGAGVNSAPSVTTGSASAITYNSATAAGTITATGCSAVTVYGIEYSTTNGFANGSGTSVPATNLSGGNFSSNLAGLAPSTAYYYKAYATNAGGTTWGAQQTFTTAALPVALTTTALTAFGNICLNTTAGPNSFTINGAFLNTTNVVVGPLAGFAFSTTATGTYSASLSLTQPGGTYTQTIYVKFTPTAVQSYNGNVPVTGGGAPATSVAASGSGVNTAPTVTTSSVFNITNHDAVLEGKIPNTGCSNITVAAIEISGIRNFANGTGTPIIATNLSAGVYSVLAENLVQGAKYYYRAYATNGGGTTYGTIDSFTVRPIPVEFSLYPVPAVRGQELRMTMKNLTPGNYSLQFFSMDGKLVHQVNFNIQVDFINQSFYLPGKFPTGVYRVQLVNFEKTLAKKTIMVF